MEKKKLARLLAGTLIFGTGMVIDRLIPVNEFIPLAVFVIAFVLLGGDIIVRALQNIVKGQVFDENFLMSIATIGAFIIGEYPEAAAVMLFFQVGVFSKYGSTQI